MIRRLILITAVLCGALFAAGCDPAYPARVCQENQPYGPNTGWQVDEAVWAHHYIYGWRYWCEGHVNSRTLAYWCVYVYPYVGVDSRLPPC